MTSFDEWQEQKQRAEADAKAAAAARAEDATLTDLGLGMWLVSLGGVNRGTVTQVEAAGEVRFSARMRHFNPGQGVLLGEYWELEKAVAAILAETPKTPGRDPFKQLTNYASREDMLERAERARQRRRAGRFSA